MTSLRGLIVSYWILVVVAATYLRTVVYKELDTLIISSLADVLLIFIQSLIIFYLFRVRNKDPFMLQALFFVLILLVFTFLRYWIEGIFQGFGWSFESQVAIKFLFTKFMTSLIISGVAVAYLVWLSYHKVKDEKHRTEMEKKQMEIDFLKSRVNPHFLFNALGGIHSLAVLQSEKTPLLIEELSKLMRYTFYDCQQARVSLSKELAFIESFINFHQLKAKDALRVNFKHDIEDGYTIEPLLFIGTIENAYKHGNVLAGGKIDLSLHLQKGKLKFVCSNSFSQQGKVQKTHQSGFGVKNLEQRLISHYPDKHQLVIEKSDDIYTVKIELEIDEKI